MTGQLILHIGDCKTGSTSLQNMMARGDGQIEGVRLFTPGGGNHGGLARSLGDRPHLYPQRWERVAKRLGEEDADTSVLSSELFEFIAPNAVLKALETHFPEQVGGMRVVVYVRPHLSRVLSQFAENVKLGHSMGDLAGFVDKYIADGRLDYSKRMARWRNTFGERLRVRPFIRAKLAEGDVRHDFMQVIADGRPYHLQESEPDDNASLNVADLALMRYVQHALEAQEELHPDNRVAFGKMMGRLLRACPSPVSSGKLRLTDALYARLNEACKADAAAMDETWFGEACFAPELERAGEDLIAAPQSLQAEDYFDAETLRQARVWTAMSVAQMSAFGDTFARAMNRA